MIIKSWKAASQSSKSKVWQRYFRFLRIKNLFQMKVTELYIQLYQKYNQIILPLCHLYHCQYLISSVFGGIWCQPRWILYCSVQSRFLIQHCNCSIRSLSLYHRTSSIRLNHRRPWSNLHSDPSRKVHGQGLTSGILLQGYCKDMCLMSQYLHTTPCH